MTLAAILALVAAACGSSSDVGAAPAEPAPTTTTAAATTTSPPTTTTTVAPTTTTVAPATTTTVADEPEPGDSGPEVDEITAAYEIVFSSETSYEDKAPLLDDPEGLEDTVTKYQETGASMGGVGLVATSVTVDGDSASVTYDLLFGGTPTYPDLQGDAVLIDGTWKITRTMFCAIMSSARVGCPAS